MYRDRRSGYGSDPYNRKDAKKGWGPKRTGCKVWRSKDGKKLGLSAWNYSKKRGLVTVFVQPRANSKIVAAKAENGGREYETMIAEITYKDSGVIHLEPCLIDLDTNKVILKKMGWVLNPNTNYCGTFKNRG